MKNSILHYMVSNEHHKKSTSKNISHYASINPIIDAICLFNDSLLMLLVVLCINQITNL